MLNRFFCAHEFCVLSDLNFSIIQHFEQLNSIGGNSLLKVKSKQEIGVIFLLKKAAIGARACRSRTIFRRQSVLFSIGASLFISSLRSKRKPNYQRISKYHISLDTFRKSFLSLTRLLLKTAKAKLIFLKSA